MNTTIYRRGIHGAEARPSVHYGFQTVGGLSKPTILLLLGGYGEALAAYLPATFDSLAAVTEEFIELARQKRLILYMQDFGGPLGMRVAVKHPDWIAGLIF